ncbi:DUF6502 family protein [Pseudomonas guariconensis]|uniref:DUF6502 family protein n=1 Tax=Pseudomonas guariconensis TaxID=1288410 RepID=UPI0018D7050A|nr:DUF6502 family protein [Pseudomonas guariconensis]MBH3358469.1 hypothetical protein [Pseudomonas guariconensis]MDM9594722.1 DUF6502 family protein [Pseudomonas guariconensis]MDM9607553.1 DUF6502 family protein [Pseudomonas guariconensis]MDM9612510.1 DUF6502 family protein [Pseudomonas guariconensis]
MHLPTLPPSLLPALRSVMRPLVRLMLRKGVTFSSFVNLLKEVFVEVAEREFRLDGKPPSDSRINLLTGVHRKDVRRLRSQVLEDEASLPEAVSFGAHLVSIWLNHEPFCEQPGEPRALPRLASVGGERSFDALVASLSTDIRARVVLDEWLRLGVVSVDEDDQVHLQTRAFIPQRGLEEKIAYFRHNLHDHACAAVHNLTDAGEPFFERSVHYDSLSQAGVQQLRDAVRTDGMQLLLTLNQLAAELEEREQPPAEVRQRITVGLYFYAEPSPPEAASATKASKP